MISKTNIFNFRYEKVLISVIQEKDPDPNQNEKDPHYCFNIWCIFDKKKT